MRAFGVLLLSIGALAGCGGPPGPGGGDLEAGFAGEPLTLVSGVAGASFTTDGARGDGLLIRFSDEEIDCRHDAERVLHFDMQLLKIEVPAREPGTYDAAQVLVQSGTSARGGGGRLVIEITDTEVVGTVDYDADDPEEPTWARGSFRVPRCFE